MATTTSTLLIRNERDEITPDEHELTSLSPPSKVAFSSAQNPLRSVTPGYRETDINLLTIEAGRPLIERRSSTDTEEDGEDEPDPIEAKWELRRQIAVTYSALTLGMNDGAPGALLPSLETYYSINYAIVSLIFLSNACGFICASFLSNKVHIMLGRCKSLVVGNFLMVLCYVILSAHPPFGAVIVAFFLVGMGMGFMLAHCNTRPNAVKVLGYMHAGYGIGAAIAPLLATQFVSHGLRWSDYYFITLGLACLSLVGLGITFRNEHSAASSEARSRQRGKLGLAIRNHITWVAATFIFLYQGAEVGTFPCSFALVFISLIERLALGGWLVTFMIQVRNGDPSTMGYTATGFWLGITVGRMLMGHTPTGKLGQKRIVYIYLFLTFILYLLFWLIPSIVASSVAIALVGICLGPLYPCTMNVLSKLVDDKELLIAVVGVVGALGNTGGALAPFSTGLLAQSKGVSVLQPVILSLVASMIVTWYFLPNIPPRNA